jgi:hypothetical protein
MNDGMNIVLHSMEQFDDLATMDVATGELTHYSRQTAPLLAARPIGGHFSSREQGFIALYRLHDVLHLRVDRTDVPLTGDVIVTLETAGSRRTLRVLRGDNTIFELEYERPKIDPPLEVDPTPFVEEEHFDFGLFVFNIMADPGRRKRIYP